MVRAQEEKQSLFGCMDCGVCTLDNGEYYMLRNAVWHEACPQRRRGVLCIGCVEARLGRQLRRADFADVPLNYLRPQSARLTDRLYGEHAATAIALDWHRGYHRELLSALAGPLSSLDGL